MRQALDNVQYVALTLAKQRLLTATFDYFQLAKPDEVIASGFKYKTYKSDFVSAVQPRGQGQALPLQLFSPRPQLKPPAVRQMRAQPINHD